MHTPLILLNSMNFQARFKHCLLQENFLDHWKDGSSDFPVSSLPTCLIWIFSHLLPNFIPPLLLRIINSEGQSKTSKGWSDTANVPAGQLSHRGTQRGMVTYRLKGPVGSTGVRSKPIRVEDALWVILVTSQVIASHKVPSSWGKKGGSLQRRLGGQEFLSFQVDRFQSGTTFSEI